MRSLHIDIETRSSVDIKAAGAYKYAQSPDFSILLIAYKLDSDPVRLIDCSKEEPDLNFRIMLTDPGIRKYAYNAAFEYYCFKRAGYQIDINQWVCTMIHAAYCGYPKELAAAGRALQLPEDDRKLLTGGALIKYFCTPSKVSGRAFNRPTDDPEKWELFKEYCMRDVTTEAAIELRLSSHPVPEREWAEWRADVLMNERGVRVDRKLVRGALTVWDSCQQTLIADAKTLTGLDNPNSITQIITWLYTQDCAPRNLTKAAVEEMLEREDLPDNVRAVLQIRQQLGKTSIKKYQAMQAAICDDDKVRGISQFYGTHTGRFAGRLVQLQNLPRNYIGTLDTARGLVRAGDYEGLRMVYGNVPDTLSQVIRTAFIPSDGHKLVVADFGAIEARVIAWLAGETWVNEVFATHGKIYEATAAQMFHVPVETIAKGQPNYGLRYRGKVATLALGYQGGVKALIAMGALDMGIPEEDLPDIVYRWRDANQNIVRLWSDVEDAAKGVIADTAPRRVGSLIFRLEHDLVWDFKYLTIELPSRRRLYYPQPRVATNKYGRPAVHFMSAKDTWSSESTYGGKLVENIVSAIARDCLTVSLRRLRTAGYDVVFHVHDEVVIDAAPAQDAATVCGIMGQPIAWAPGLILKAAGFESTYYMKD